MLRDILVIVGCFCSKLDQRLVFAVVVVVVVVLSLLFWQQSFIQSSDYVGIGCFNYFAF